MIGSSGGIQHSNVTSSPISISFSSENNLRGCSDSSSAPICMSSCISNSRFSLTGELVAPPQAISVCVSPTGVRGE